ncbi:MAG: hypothetical protein U0X93_05215 [Anaerolineales bacterium]
MQNKNQFAKLVLFTALLFGLMIRLAAPMTAGDPSTTADSFSK